LLRDGRPDASAMNAAVTRTLERSATFDPAAPLRAYGEMVDLLCARGDREAAIELERLWNEVARRHPMTLLCTYSRNHFAHAAHDVTFQHVCGEHSHVFPTESYALAEPDDRLRQVSTLQQQARALESEIAHRRHVEAALREAVRQRDEFLAVAGHEL